ncbi:MAG: transposase [Patescibacteria group bacterium]
MKLNKFRILNYKAITDSASGSLRKGDACGKGTAERGRFSFDYKITLFCQSWYYCYMPRAKRLLLSQSYYHIMTRGNNRSVVFRSPDDYLYYLELLAKYKIEHPFDLYHYCLMPTHTHFQIQTKHASEFSVFMKKINLAYFHHYQQKYNWVGHFWQDRFKSQTIGKDAYFIQCGKYIELNPIRADLAKSPEEYLYSSYRFYSMGEKNPLITPDFMYEAMGKNEAERQTNYQGLLVAQIIEESYRKPIWGSDIQRYREQDKIDRKIKT